MNTTQHKIFVLFGATGDLAREKIVPALYQIYSAKKEHEILHIVALSRRNWNDEQYHGFLLQESALTRSRPGLERGDVDNYTDFLTHIHYIAGDIQDGNLYQQLKEYLDTIMESKTETQTVVSYVATAPRFYGDIITHGVQAHIWGRGIAHTVLIEKPYADTAVHFDYIKQMLDTNLGDHGLLIDHYLGKAPLRSVDVLHNDAEIWQEIMRKLTHITVYIYEKYDVDRRGEFYDAIGAFMDVGANHMLQTLAHILDPQHTRDILDSLSVVSARRAQYEGYRTIPHVDPQSETETAFDIHLVSSMPQYTHLDIRLVGGKAFAENMSGATLVAHGTTLVEIEFKPRERIYAPLFNIDMSYTDSMDAYCTVIADLLSGQHTYTVTSAEGYAEWGVGTKVRETWKSTDTVIYQKGAKPDMVW